MLKTVEFYENLFGFKVKKDQPQDNSKIIGNDSIKFCLYEDPDLNLENKEGINHFGFHVDNFDKVVDKCKELNVPVLLWGKC